METILPEITESELDATFGGQGEAATCAAPPDGWSFGPGSYGAGWPGGGRGPG
jgi:hypothetical protein